MRAIHAMSRGWSRTPQTSWSTCSKTYGSGSRSHAA